MLQSVLPFLLYIIAREDRFSSNRQCCSINTTHHQLEKLTQHSKICNFHFWWDSNSIGIFMHQFCWKLFNYVAFPLNNQQWPCIGWEMIKYEAKPACSWWDLNEIYWRKIKSRSFLSSDFVETHIPQYVFRLTMMKSYY